ncbi:MAG TPA: recombinase family protein [Candidatus Faeciplasma pullistercoris]|uniref:Recombinase family protein n=1 Tax=Candidatus Faeciplasma pullistercoris TaxID=2840800 RepID=A0A9D1KL78_9FIRM|nr:recombinase family protein [Candidatus Faeciplasma pullistercoris]
MADADFVVFSDYCLIGTRPKRNEFLRLMRDCRQGKIDRILVKSVSRFARNAQDCI